jgi:glycosyltransferase involved in cell wall biosynthesis
MKNKLISVIIPTYREPSHLDICLESVIKGQVYHNEIIVVVDGFFDENKHVLSKYKDYIKVLDLETNQGLPRATNLGVYNSSNSIILVINDDNVLPLEWDKILLEEYKDGMVLTPNQIEPYSSMFRQFYIKDMGKNPSEFNLEYFQKEEKEISIRYGEEYNHRDNTGSTLPFMTSKNDYIKIGGWDENFPTNGTVADWEFFLRCSMNHLQMCRTYRAHVYHFVSVGTGTNRQESELQGHEWARYKWGSYIHHDPNTNKKYLVN